MTTTNTTTSTTTAERMTPAEMFHNLKAKHPGCVLLLRTGDFYETYESDAQTCAEVLGISALPISKGGFTFMAGFPHYAIDTYLPRLIRAGHKVAICDCL